jgi:hypothetical protein
MTVTTALMATYQRGITVPFEVSLPILSWTITLCLGIGLAHDLPLPRLAIPTSSRIMINTGRCVYPDRAVFNRLRDQLAGELRVAGSVNDGDCPVDLNVFADLLSRFRVKAEQRQRSDTDKPKYQGACLTRSPIEVAGGCASPGANSGNRPKKGFPFRQMNVPRALLQKNWR